jgi:dihydroorotate dehydrogenase (fumarate)
MINLETTYMGLKLQNPLIAGSSGLTNSINQIKQLANAGVGAIVLKSLFEEQINGEISNLVNVSEQHNDYPEAEDYIKHYTRSNSIQKYLELVREAKAAVNVPVIASINCISATDWMGFAKDIEQAGADALELNIYELETNKNRPAEVIEERYFEIVRAVKAQIKIPIAVKIAPYFTNLVRFIDQITAFGADSVTLFNRFYEPDFNLDKLEFTSSEIMSSPSDLYRNLRWTGIVKGQLPRVEIAASTGIHNGQGVIKQILAGAQVTQLCSTLYLNGSEVVPQILNELELFMNKWQFNSINNFRAHLSYKNIEMPQMYERAQFMKYFSSK